jgi:hypothetical protein
MDIERIKAIKAAHEERLLRKANVIGVGVGLRQQRGQTTDQVCIVVSVREKVPSEQLAPKDVIPSYIEGVPVDVQATGEILAL